VIKVPKKVVGVELDVKFYVYKTKTNKYHYTSNRQIEIDNKRYMITRVNTKGNSSSTPHALFSEEDIEKEEIPDEVGCC
jgi:hypothetical protein